MLISIRSWLSALEARRNRENPTLMSLLAMPYAEHIARNGGVADPYISAVWCGLHGAPKALCRPSSYHISTTEPPEQQEKPGNKKDLND